MVFISPRPRHESAVRGVCDRSRRRPGGDAQPTPTPNPLDSDAGRRPERPLSDRRDAASQGTDVHPIERSPVGVVATSDGIETPMSACETGHDHDHHDDDGTGHHTGRTPGHVDDMGGAPTWMQRRIHRMIVWYQRLREGRPSPCRFYPTCSSYALEAFEVHGTLRGGWLTVRRLVRCRPLGPSGVDPVPPARDVTDASMRPPQKGS